MAATTDSRSQARARRVDHDRRGRRQHDRIGCVLLPAALAVVALEYGSGSLLAWGVTGVGAMLLAMVFAEPRPRVRRPEAVRLRATGVRRLHGVPDRLGLLDRRMGGERRDRDGIRRSARGLHPSVGGGDHDGHVWAYVTAIGTIGSSRSSTRGA